MEVDLLRETSRSPQVDILLVTDTVEFICRDADFGNPKPKAQARYRFPYPFYAGLVAIPPCACCAVSVAN